MCMNSGNILLHKRVYNQSLNCLFRKTKFLRRSLRAADHLRIPTHKTTMRMAKMINTAMTIPAIAPPDIPLPAETRIEETS